MICTLRISKGWESLRSGEVLSTVLQPFIQYNNDVNADRCMAGRIDSFFSEGTPHCKDKMPKIWNKYSQKRNIGASVAISTFMCLLVNYIFPRWVCLFCWRKYVDWSWEYINRSKTHECGNWGWEAVLFPEKEYINGIAVAVHNYYGGHVFLKGTVSRDFLLLIFYESVSPKPLSTPLGPFRFF